MKTKVETAKPEDTHYRPIREARTHTKGAGRNTGVTGISPAGLWKRAVGAATARKHGVGVIAA